MTAPLPENTRLQIAALRDRAAALQRLALDVEGFLTLDKGMTDQLEGWTDGLSSDECADLSAWVEMSIATVYRLTAARATLLRAIQSEIVTRQSLLEFTALQHENSLETYS